MSDRSHSQKTSHSVAKHKRGMPEDPNGYLLRTIMDHLPDHVYFKDMESRFIAVNRAMATWFGFEDTSELIGKSDADLFSEEHARRALEDEQKIIQSGEPLVGVEEKETWQDGRETWVSTTKLPLRDDEGRIIGTFGLSRNVNERKKAQQQLAISTEELRLKNKVLEEDLEIARELQSSMLPQRFPCFPRDATEQQSALRFHHFYRPSMTVSGDFFDVLEISDTSAGIFICDVMGHGVRAAIVAAIVRALVHELKPLWTKPGELLTQLNRALRDTLKQGDTPMFASAFYVVADISKGKVTYANAGHPSPFFVHHAPDSQKPHQLNGLKPYPVLGLFDDLHYPECTSVLSAQDVILLFTDGLFEVEGAQGPYDYRHLLSAVSRRRDLPTDELCRELIEEVQEYSESHEFLDDVCLVAMEVDHLVR